MAFLSLKSESAKSSFYNMKIRVEKVLFICCCLRHPKLHKYSGECRSVKVQLPNWEKCLKNGFGQRFALLEISTSSWGCLGSLSGFCTSAKEPPKVGGMKGRLCLERGLGTS